MKVFLALALLLLSCAHLFAEDHLAAATLEFVSEDEGKWEKARRTLIEGGRDSIWHLAPYVFVAEDPELAQRVRVLRNSILYGIPDGIPKELRKRLLNFHRADAEERVDLVKKLTQVRPVGPEMLQCLACLYAWHLEKFGLESTNESPFGKLLLEEFSKRGKVRADLMRLNLRNLRVEVMVCLLDALMSQEAAIPLSAYQARANPAWLTSMRLYQRWRKEAPELPTKLGAESIVLELAYLASKNDHLTALNLIRNENGTEVNSMVFRQITDWLGNGSRFPIKQMTDTQAMGWVHYVYSGIYFDRAYLSYQKTIREHPTLKDKLPMSLYPFRIFETLQGGDVSAAMALYFEAGVDLEKPTKHFEAVTSNLVKILEKDLKKLNPSTVPKLPGNLSEPFARMLTVKLFENADLDFAKAIFERVTADDESNLENWLQLVQEHAVTFFFEYQAEKAALNEIIDEIAERGQLQALGNFLRDSLKYCEQIRAENALPKHLVEILTGLMPRSHHFVVDVELMANLSDQWTLENPGLRDSLTRSQLTILAIYHYWQVDDLSPALGLLSENEEKLPKHVYLAFRDQLIASSLTDPTFSLPEKWAEDEFKDSVLEVIHDRMLNRQISARQFAQAFALGLNSRPERSLRLAVGMEEQRRLLKTLYFEGDFEACEKLVNLYYWFADEALNPHSPLLGMMGFLGCEAAVFEFGNDLDLNKREFTRKQVFLARQMGDLDEALNLAMAIDDEKLIDELLVAKSRWKELLERNRLILSSFSPTYLPNIGAHTRQVTFLHLSGGEAELEDLVTKVSEQCLKDAEHRNRGYMDIAYLAGQGRKLQVDIENAGQSPLYCSPFSWDLKYMLAKFIVDFEAFAKSDSDRPERFDDFLRLFILAPWFTAEQHDRVTTSAIQVIEANLLHVYDDIVLLHYFVAYQRTDRVAEFIKKLLQRLDQDKMTDSGKKSRLSELFFACAGQSRHSRIEIQAMLRLLKFALPDKPTSEHFNAVYRRFKEDRLKAVKWLHSMAIENHDRLNETDQRAIAKALSQLLYQPIESHFKPLAEAKFPLQKLEMTLFPAPRKSVSPYFVDFYWPLGRYNVGRPFIPRKITVDTDQADPTKSDFWLSHGHQKSIQLWNEGKRKEALELVRMIALRCLMEERESPEGRQFRVSSNNEKASPFYSPTCLDGYLCHFHFYPAPVELSEELFRIYAWQPYGFSIRELLMQYGAHSQAYPHAVIDALNGGTAKDAVKARGILHQVSAAVCAEAGDFEGVLRHVGLCLAICPHDIRYFQEVKVALKNEGSDQAEETIIDIDSMVKTFWSERLKEFPKYPPYEQALADWDALWN